MTIEELARQAGVSTATVSNALSGKGAMTSETRSRIVALADEMGYQPQAAARALATGRRNTIGYVTGPTNLPDDLWTAEEANQRTPVMRAGWTKFGDNIEADPGFAAADTTSLQTSIAPCARSRISSTFVGSDLSVSTIAFPPIGAPPCG